MGPRPSALLGLVLCLGQTIHTQDGRPPKPSLRAEPGPVILRGRPVTFVCQGPAGATIFRLEQEGRKVFTDQKSAPQDGRQLTEARFPIQEVNEHTARSYHCLYKQGPNNWSELSDRVRLQVTEEDVSAPPPGLLNSHIYVLIGTSVACLLGLLLLVLLLVHRQHQRKHKSPHGKGEKQRPKERLSPAADTTESKPGEATAYGVPEKERELQNPSPSARDSQEVTYAQLDQRALTLRAAQAVSPPPAEPAAAASTYAELPRR